jgi:prolyl-tRNA editing enzyme YbaK/EbsC (Cys-tRNA(Pro) deacylase)
VNEKTIALIIGEPIVKADADFVREKTGFAIGGVPPLGHATEMGSAFIDEDLPQFSELWAAAGTPHAVFQLTPFVNKRIYLNPVSSSKSSWEISRPL